MMKIQLLILTLTVLAVAGCNAQQKLNADTGDETRFTSDTLNGVYIPKDFDDCFRQINLFWNDSTKSVVRQWTEREFTGRAHMGFGLWMRNNWRLWGGSRLSKYFNEMGIYHPDDMSGIILISYHRYLNNKEIGLDAQVAWYQRYWEEAEANEQKRRREEFRSYQIGDTVLFTYNFGFSTPEQEKQFENGSCVATGKIVSVNNKNLKIKVSLIESCGEKGIVCSDSKHPEILSLDTLEDGKPKKTSITYMKAGQKKWFFYDQWTTF